MKSIPLLFCPIFFVLLHVACSAQQSEYDYIIRQVNIVRPERKHPLSPNRDVYIKGGRVFKIKKSAKHLPKASKAVIDGTGKYLMAGLADMHAHIPAENTERYLLLNLAAGVTTIRSMRGDPSHIRLKRSIGQGDMLGPDLIISAPAMHAQTPVPADSLSALLAGYKQAGFDLIKVLSIPDSAYFDKLMSAAKAGNILVAGHSPGQISVNRVVQSGYSSIEHLQSLIKLYQKDSTALGPIISRIKAANTYNCPTLDWYAIAYMQYSLEELKARRGLAYVDRHQVNQWIKQIENDLSKQSRRDQDSVAQEQQRARTYIQHKLRLVKMLSDAGAPLLLSPDATGAFGVPGFSMYEEMQLYSKAGINNRDILKAAVYNPAQYLQQQKEWGSIKPRMKANLILLAKDPLVSIENIQHVEAVMLHGNFLPITDLRGRLRENSSQ